MFKNSLSKLLTKFGVKSQEDLSPDELVTYERYKTILNGDSVTIDGVKEFCRSQIKIIESKCDGVNLLTAVQQASLHVYMNILRMIEAPEQERESLERYLNQIIESTPTQNDEN